MASVHIRFEDERLSTTPRPEDLEHEAPTVSAAFNLVMYRSLIPLQRPAYDPNAAPQFRSLVMANDRQGPVFDSLSAYQCSRDGSMWAYYGIEIDRKSRRSVNRLVVNGVPKREMENVFHVSPAGNGVASLHREGPFWMSVNDKPEGKYEQIRDGAYGARGDFAYIGETLRGRHVVVNGKQSEAFADVRELCWSPDGSRLAYRASTDLIHHRVIDNGNPGPDYSSIHSVTFSPDSRRLAYVAGLPEGRMAVVVDGKAGPAFGNCHDLRFSGDSNRILYKVTSDPRAGMWAIAVDHVPGKAYDDVQNLECSHDGTSHAYAARWGEHWKAVVGTEESEPAEHIPGLAVGRSGGTAYALLQGNRTVVVHNGRRVHETPMQFGRLTLNENGTRVAWVEGKKGLFVDGKLEAEAAWAESMVFAPDGSTLVSVVRIGRDHFLRIGGRSHGPMKVFTPPVFNDAGDKVAVVALIGREVWRKVFPV